MDTKKQSRTTYAIKNAAVGAVMQIINIILGFIGRTIFIYLLNSDYLGVNSLFTNILTMLSFAELGIGSAIVFSLYKPIANNDKHKIQMLMKLYQKAYWIIGTAIFAMGLCVIPFMGYIIRDTPDIKENIILIYILFLINTSVSYFFSYKKSLITASQRDYIVQIYTRVFQFVQIVLQSVFLLLTHEYIIYLIIHIACTIILNFVLSYKADKMYPYLKNKNKDSLSKDETKSIFANVRALFIYKLGSVILNGTDNIIISSLISVAVVGIASNYTMLTTSAANVISMALGSVTASVGNLSVKGSKSQIRSVMHELLLLCVWLYGFVCIGFLVLSNDFVKLWIGDSYVLDQIVVIAILFSTYINGIQYAAYTFRTTQGLFVQSQWVPIITSIINIVLSIWWGKLIGLAGIFAATGIARLFTTTIVDPWLIYKNNFDEKPYEYYLKYFLETAAIMINAAIQMIIVKAIPFSGWSGFFIKGIIISVSINLVFLFEFGWTKEFRGLINRLTQN